MIVGATKHRTSRSTKSASRANRQSDAALSKPSHRCRLALRGTCSLGKARCKNTSAPTKAVRYYHRSQQYSVTALTDSNGNVTERYAYTAYGTPTITDGAGATLTNSANNNRYTYTGREWDEALNLYHYRARMYDSICGRFLGRDPIGFAAGAVGLYEYVRGWATRAIDPSGNQLVSGGGAAVLGAV